jgi:hypothetical protein
MSGTGPSESLTKLSPIHGPKARALGPLSLQGDALRSHIHFRVIDAESNTRTDALGGSSLSAAQINKCMLLLLVICVVLASTILGAVGYLSEEERPRAESRAPAQLGIEH